MGTTPEELKREIDLTREDLAQTVDALAVKITPSPKAKRVTGAVVGSLFVLLLVAKVKGHRRA